MKTLALNANLLERLEYFREVLEKRLITGYEACSAGIVQGGEYDQALRNKIEGLLLEEIELPRVSLAPKPIRDAIAFYRKFIEEAGKDIKFPLSHRTYKEGCIGYESITVTFAHQPKYPHFAKWALKCLFDGKADIEINDNNTVTVHVPIDNIDTSQNTETPRANWRFSDIEGPIIFPNTTIGLDRLNNLLQPEFISDECLFDNKVIITGEGYFADACIALLADIEGAPIPEWENLYKGPPAFAQDRYSCGTGDMINVFHRRPFIVCTATASGDTAKKTIVAANASLFRSLQKLMQLEERCSPALA